MQCREYMAGAGATDLPAPRDIAHLLARFSCNSHTICDEELRVIGEASCFPHLVLWPFRETSCFEALQTFGFDHDAGCPLVSMSG